MHRYCIYDEYTIYGAVISALKKSLAPKPNKKREVLIFRFWVCAGISFILVFLFPSLSCAHLPPEQLLCLCAISYSVCTILATFGFLTCFSNVKKMQLCGL